jgi:hypothetical protein
MRHIDGSPAVRARARARHWARGQARAAHLVDPVGVQHAQAAHLAARALLGHIAQVAGGLQLGDTLVHGLTVNDALQAEGEAQRV